MVSGRDLPRWTFSLYWRRDGKPIWRNPTDRQEEGHRAQPPRPPRISCSHCRDNLGIEPDHVVPAYEDPAEWILKEGNLPDNVTPENSKLNDPEERAPHRHRFSRGLTEPAGYVLPVQRWQSQGEPVRAGGRRNGRLRRGHVFLVPGDSPVGYRLPLGAAHVPPAPIPYVNPPIRRAARTAARPSDRQALDALPWQTACRRCRPPGARPVHAPPATQQPVEQSMGIDGAVRTAISVEPRDGRLCVFMPPVERSRTISNCIAAAEDAAAGWA
jgi:uncharacterized protein (DUF2126 family)